MSTRRSYDSDALRAVAKKLGGLSAPLADAGGAITGAEGGTPFGALPSSDGISSALKSFIDGLKKEFEAGAKLMDATETSISAVAKDMDGIEDENAASFKPKGGARAV